MADHIEHDHNNDGIDRRGFLKCMAWAGTGALWMLAGGVLKSFSLSDLASPAFADSMKHMKSDFSFVQISDSHIGFNKPANPDVIGTLKAAVDKINALHTPPAFVLHTGDLTQLAKPDQFDTLDQVVKSIHTSQVFYVPGEHDVLNDNGKLYLSLHGKHAKGDGWYSFDYKGTHFIGLVNVLNLKAGGLGSLGQDQVDWLKDDVAHLPSSTPIVVFAHIPLWTVYADWGWGTDDSAQALSYLKRFGSVTVLNGHIHQTMQKVEGNVTFHTAMSTAFPQPKPGTAPSPGPMKVPAGELRSVLGITDVHYRQGHHALAVIDSPLQGASARTAALAATSSPRQATPARTTTDGHQVVIDNFTFNPATLTVPAGTTVDWVNKDDEVHTVTSVNKTFASKGLDTGDRYSFRFTAPGTYPYFCSIHPHMTGKVIVH